MAQRQGDRRKVERRTPKRGVNVRHTDARPESVKRIRRGRPAPPIPSPTAGSFDPADHRSDLSPFQTLVSAELAKARTTNGDMHSTHEAFGVVLEEGVEWFIEIMANNAVLGLKELVQVAAMCQRAAEDVYGVKKE